jgi:hypothetical protein
VNVAVSNSFIFERSQVRISEAEYQSVHAMTVTTQIEMTFQSKVGGPVRISRRVGEGVTSSAKEISRMLIGHVVPTRLWRWL